MATPVNPAQSLRILVLGPAREAAAQLLDQLRDTAQVVFADEQGSPPAAISPGDFDLVIGAPAEMLTESRDAKLLGGNTVLEHLAQGVCVIDDTGRVHWANASFAGFEEPAAETIRQACTNLLRELLAVPDAKPGQRSQSRSVCAGPERYFDASMTLLPPTADGTQRGVANVCDTTAMLRLRSKIDAIDAAGRQLVALDVDATARLDVSERLRLLEEKVINHCRDLLHFNHFAVQVIDPATNRLEVVLSEGFPESVKQLEIHVEREGNGISGYVAATGQSFVCPDLSQEPRYLHGLEGAWSALTVPLRLNERVVGVLNVESAQINAFSEEDRQVAEIFGRYVATALHLLKLLAVERNETTSQVASDVQTELAEPLNDIVFAAAQLLEDASVPEEASARLHQVIDSVDRVKSVLRGVADASGVQGLVTAESAVDPVIENRRVLIADDEDIIRETIADVLSKAGAITVMARNGDEAVSMIHTQHFDLVLSDIKMPYKNGYEVFAAARESNLDCRVILITGFGYDPEHSIVRASREGLAGVLFKPFKVDQLFDLIRQALTPSA